MQCDQCKQKASVFYKQIVGGNVLERNLCEDCARELGITDPTTLGALANEFLNADPHKPVSEPVDSGEGAKCQACGYTIKQLHDTSRVGCGYCYVEFRDQIEALLKPMHGASRHAGSLPKGFEQAQLKETRKILKTRIDEAVKKEDYELAAELRDSLNALNEENNENSPV